MNHAPDHQDLRQEASGKCFELLDQYVELEIQGADADQRIPGLRNHLHGCPACREERDSLLALVTAEHPAA